MIQEYEEDSEESRHRITVKELYQCCPQRAIYMHRPSSFITYFSDTYAGWLKEVMGEVQACKASEELLW